jgi:hypothetical protein
VTMYETYEGEWEGQELLEGEEEFQEQEWGGEIGEFAEYGEMQEGEEEGFLGGLLGSVLGGLGREVAETESPLGEVAETELAMELLEVGSEAELEQFLGNLFKRVGQSAGRFMNSSTGRALGGVLKNVAKKALPVAGGALGSIVPGVGTAIGSTLGSMASRLFEVELETLGEEEAEFEAARRFVRFAGSAARNATAAPRTAPPQAVARAAVVSAARRHAPGLVRGTRYQAAPGPRGAARGAGARGRPRPGAPAAARPGAPAARPSAPGARPGAPAAPGMRPPSQRPPRPGPRPSYGGRPAWGGYGAAYGVEDVEPTYQPDYDDTDGGAYGDDGASWGGRRPRRPRSGRWYRRGARIVLIGA